jgi:RNA polymerase sigma-70 factor (ECF subfamily)
VSSTDAITAFAMRARRGDTASATAFVQATQAEVWRMVCALSSRDEADDLTQETYVRAFASLHRFAGRSSARTWLLSIARRVCADAVRGKTRERSYLGVIESYNRQHDHEVAQTPRSADPADSAGVRAILRTLDPVRREAFVLTQLVGLSYAEAADVCRCPVGTIRSRVARARDDLVAALGEGNARATS